MRIVLNPARSIGGNPRKDFSGAGETFYSSSNLRRKKYSRVNVELEIEPDYSAGLGGDGHHQGCLSE